MEDATCLICREDGCNITTKCNHYFHTFCIKQWCFISEVCPLCRRPIILSEIGLSLSWSEEEIKSLDVNILLNVLLDHDIFMPFSSTVSASLDALSAFNEFDFDSDSDLDSDPDSDDMDSLDSPTLCVFLLAIEYGKEFLVERMIEQDVNINCIVNGPNIDYPTNALSVACKKGNVSIARLLLEAGAQIYEFDFSSRNYSETNSQLKVAYFDEQVEIFKLLIQYGASSSFATNYWMEEAIKNINANFEFSLQKLKFLMRTETLPSHFPDCLAPHYPQILNCLLDSNYSFIDHLDSLLNFESIAWIEFFLDTVAIDVNCQNSFGETPVLLVTKYSNTKLFLKLVKLGADINLTSNLGDSVLFHATIKFNNEILDEALRLGADVNLSHLLFKRTALHNAFIFGNFYAITKLVEFGSSLTVEDQKGKTPLEYFSSSHLTDLLGTVNLSHNLALDEACKCTICDEEACDFVTDCNHSIHFKCMSTWLALFRTCPICKCVISDDKIVELFKFSNELLRHFDEERIENILMDACAFAKFPIDSFFDYLNEIGWDFAGKSGPILSFASKYKNLHMVKLLVQNGANINFDFDRFLKDKKESKCTCGIDSIENSDIEDFFEDDEYPTTALWTALLPGNEEIFKYLIENGADKDMVAAVLACRKVQSENIENIMNGYSMLVDAGVSPNEMRQCVSFAICNKDFAIFERIIGLGYNSVDTFVDLLNSSEPDWIEYFLQHAEIQVNSTDMLSRTFALLAAIYNETDLFLKFASLGADVNIVDSLGYSILYYSVLGKNDRIFDEALKRGALVDLTFDENGFTAFNFACTNENYHAVEELLKHNVVLDYENTEFWMDCSKNPRLDDIFKRLAPGYNNLDLYIQEIKTEYTLEEVKAMTDEEICEHLKSSFDCPSFDSLVECLRAIKWNFSFKGGPLLIEAAQQGNLYFLKKLLKLGVDKNFGIESRYTAVSHACKNGHLDIVSALFKAGADLLIFDFRRFKTPLYEALDHGHFEIANYLICNDQEVRFNERFDSNGDFAARYWFECYINLLPPIADHVKILAFLLDYKFDRSRFITEINRSIVLAVEREDFAVFACFAEAGCNCINAFDELVKSEKFDWIEICRKHPNFSYTKRDCNGNNLTLIAAKYGATELFMDLIKYHKIGVENHELALGFAIRAMNDQILNATLFELRFSSIPKGSELLKLSRTLNYEYGVNRLLQLGVIEIENTEQLEVPEPPPEQQGFWKRIFSCFN